MAGRNEGEGVLLMYSCGAGGEKGRVWIFRITWKNSVDECVVSVGESESVESYTRTRRLGWTMEEEVGGGGIGSTHFEKSMDLFLEGLRAGEVTKPV